MDEGKVEQKIKEIEKEILETPYHKGTEHHIGKLKGRLAQLRDESLKNQMRKSGGGGGGGFAVRKDGDATVVLVGMPSVGKSTLLNRLTNAKSKVAAYPFTTLDVIPGTMDYKDAKIQIFDVPGMIEGAAGGRAGGKEILSVVRVADLLLMMAPADEPETFRKMEKELVNAGVRINQLPPKISIEKKLRGGLEITGNIGKLSKETIRAICQEFRLFNAKINFQSSVNEDQLIDSLLVNRVYVRAIYVVSKTDRLSREEIKRLEKELKKGRPKEEFIFISIWENSGIEELKEKIFKKLGLIHIFLRRDASAEPARSGFAAGDAGGPEKKPMICCQGATVLELAGKISNSLARELKGAKIVGTSAKYKNQLIGPNHILSDGDQVFFVK